MEFIEKFGIDWKLLIAQAVNFLIVLVVLWKFAYKPILRMLQDRTDKIDKGLESADRMERLKAEIEQEKVAVMSQAKKEAQTILQEAHSQTEKNRQAQVEKTKAEVAQLVSKAKGEIEQEKQRVMKQAEKELGGLAVSIAEKMIRREISSADQQRLVDDAMKQVG